MRLKRLLDIVLGLALLVPLLPVMGAIALLVLVTSGRPVLYRATRVGLGGEAFVMLKFRTMGNGPASHAAAITGPQDPRLTRAGRLLRAGRLDELPQLFNVLRGEMSLVGPRPEDPRFVAGYTAEQREVLSVRPGVTSPTAIAFRGEADLLPTDPALRDAYYAEVLLPQKLDLDLHYVRSRSLLGDVRILARTVRSLGAASPATVTPAPPNGELERARVVVLGAVDGFANGARAREMVRFLRSHGHRVDLVDTNRLSRGSSREGSWRARLPGLHPLAIALYAVEAAAGLVRSRRSTRGRLSYPLLVAEQRLRRALLAASLNVDDAALVIAETPHDASYLASLRNVPTLYDCPTPWADELRDEGRLTPRQHRAMRRREVATWTAVDHLSFHWHTYAAYARQHYGLRGDHVVDLDWGCRPSAVAAVSAAPPRVVYLGSLSSRFINLGLLARLCRLYPHIDVYGGPEPDPSYGLPYRGWAPVDVLADYQFGLITCTRDDLRRHGFSAKHLEYLAAGLPVLAPSWRVAAFELGATLGYDEESFVQVVQSNGERERWDELATAARRQANVLCWDDTLRGLDDLIGRHG